MTDEERELLITHVNALMKHFDSVQVFVNRVEPDRSTSFFHFGRGNFFSRYGQVRMWLGRAEAVDEAEGLRQEEKEDWQGGDD